MLVGVGFARMIVKRAIKQSINGDKVNVPVVMKAIDALGDGDGQVEMSDVITAVSNYVSDIGDKIAAVAHYCPEVIENAGVSVSGLLGSIGEGIGNTPDVVTTVAKGAGDFFTDLIDTISDWF